MEYIYNVNTNTVTAIMHSDKKLRDTKTSWTLSEDKLSYSKIFGDNMNYSTPVQDIWGNETIVNINITRNR